jgi:hypothetical protein
VNPFTFSSGLMVAIRFRDQVHGIVAGEPPGERPNHYGEVKSMKLPNSGIEVRYAVKHHVQVHGDPPLLEPELRIPLTAADFLAGRDPLLDRITSQPQALTEGHSDRD